MQISEISDIPIEDICIAKVIVVEIYLLHLRKFMFGLLTEFMSTYELCHFCFLLEDLSHTEP